MRKSTVVALAAVALVSIAVRLSPLWSFLYWGSDTGEYFSILRALVRGDHLSTTYYGWGVTYPYFPGMFFAQAGVVDLGGLDVPTTINLLVPILGALAVLPAFLVAHRMAGDDRFALFAAAFLAGAIPVAYTTAHMAPATVGELLALVGLLCFVRLRTDRRAMVPLLLVTATLIATHHLSLYFFLVMVLGTIVLEGLARPWRWTPGAKREVTFASVLLAGTFAYWLGYAATFRESILPDVNIQPWWALLALFPAGLVLLGGIIFVRSRFSWRYRPRYPALRRPAIAYTAAFGTIFVIGVISVAIGVPGTTFRVPAIGLLYFVPLVLLLSFSASGRPFGDFLADGLQVNGWLVALLGSAAVGIAAAPRVLIPYRHSEYLMVPLAIFAGIGFFRLLDLAGLRGGKRTFAVGMCGVLVAVRPEERHVHLDRPRHGGRRPSHAVGNRRTHERDGHREIRRVPVRQGLRQRIRSTLLDRLGLHAVDVLSRTLLSGSIASAAAMRVAVLHDHLRFIGGGERVALTLAAAFDADLYVTDLDPTLPGRAGMPKVRVTEIARVPRMPPMRQDRQARAFREYAIPDHDVYLLSGNWAVFAAPRLRPNLWYCHTPVRVFYDLHDSFLSSLPRVRRWAAQRWIERRRPEYEAAVAAVQTIVANSRNVEARIERFLHRTAEVVYPPVDTSRYRFGRIGVEWLAV